MRLKPPPEGRSRSRQLITGAVGCWIAAGGVAFVAGFLGAGHRGKEIAWSVAFAVFLALDLIDAFVDVQ
jgi:hypothetical protein